MDNELYKFYLNNEDFKEYVDKCVKSYGKDVPFMLSTQATKEYYKYLKEKEK